MKNTDLPPYEKTIKAINRFQKWNWRGLCLAYKWQYNVDSVLRKLGGRHLPKTVYYWPVGYCSDIYEEPEVFKASKQRMMMLAFLLTWAEDPDFEV